VSKSQPFSSVQASPRALLAIVFCSLLALSCGGGGGSASSSAGTGTASVFLTDAPSDDFDEILVTITAVELLGADGPIVIFRGRETVDLKELEDFSDLFVYAEKVPVGRYSKIRMRVERVVLVKDDDETDVDPPADGHIDLVPKGPFEIREGVHLVIEIDMDAKKSIHISGNGKKYNFRPVVFM
jgi:hypothetical protein